MEPRGCIGPGCEVAFLPERRWQAFCSTGCGRRYWILARRVGVKILELARAGDLVAISLVATVERHEGAEHGRGDEPEG